MKELDVITQLKGQRPCSPSTQAMQNERDGSWDQSKVLVIRQVFVNEAGLRLSC